MLEWHARTVWGLDETAAKLKKEKNTSEMHHRLRTEDYFAEDKYVGLREAEQNPFLKSPGIDLESLQDSLMEI